MPQQFLHYSFPRAAFKQVGGETMPECVGGNVFGDVCPSGGGFQDSPGALPR